MSKKLQERILEAGRLWGLPVRSQENAVFGNKEGFAVQMRAGESGSSPALVGVVSWGQAEKDAQVAERLKSSAALKEAKVNPSEIEVTSGSAFYVSPFSFSFSLPDAEALAKRMQAVLAEVRLAVGTPSAACALCAKVNVPEPILLEGVVARVCAGCLQTMEAKARRESEAYENKPTRWLAAFAVGAISAVIGAAVWDGVILATNRMFWLLAIAIGAAIGWSVTKAAGKGGRGVQMLAGGFTLLSVTGGMLLLIVLSAVAQATVDGVLKEALVAGHFMTALKGSIGDLLFSTGGAALGALGAAGKAARPKLEVTVQR